MMLMLWCFPETYSLCLQDPRHPSVVDVRYVTRLNIGYLTT